MKLEFLHHQTQTKTIVSPLGLEMLIVLNSFPQISNNQIQFLTCSQSQSKDAFLLLLV